MTFPYKRECHTGQPVIFHTDIRLYYIMTLVDKPDWRMAELRNIWGQCKNSQ